MPGVLPGEWPAELEGMRLGRSVRVTLTGLLRRSLVRTLSVSLLRGLSVTPDGSVSKSRAKSGKETVEESVGVALHLQPAAKRSLPGTYPGLA